jgi:hypothetical protein
MAPHGALPPPVATNTPTSAQEEQRKLRAHRETIVCLIWAILIFPYRFLFPTCTTDTHWPIIYLFCFPLVTVSSMPAEREDGTSSTVRKVIKTWMTRPKLQAGNFWLELWILLTLVACMRAVLGPFVDPVLESLLY